nr:efflux transporter periplasmic adaptor subunit [Prevotella sp.]
MNTKINIILVLSFVLTLLSCKSAHKEKSEENEKHTDEIVFTQKQAAEAGVRLETVKYGDFQNVIKVGGQIQSAFGEEQTVVATADGIVSFAKSSVSDGIPISAGQSIVTISANKLQDGDPSQKAKNVYEAAEREYNRVKELVSERIISVKDFEQVRLRYETAKVAYLGLARNMTAHGVNVASHI